MDKVFEDWFNERFPVENFGSLGGAFRLAIKEDIAKTAFKEGLKLGIATNVDKDLYLKIESYLK